MSARIYRYILAALVVVAVASCSFPFGHLGDSARTKAIAQGEATLSISGAHSLLGVLEWPLPRAQGIKAQALASNVVSQATVALIDYNTGNTVATTLSDNTGSFVINVGSYSPATGQFFYLEAVKGANSQAPGSGTLRLRSVAEWTGTGWVSCTNASVGGAIAIEGLTTALALEVGLGRATPAQVIGASDTNTPPDLLISPINGTVSGSEVLALEGNVNNYVLDNQDPVSQTSQVSPSLSSLTPNAGVVGQVVAINGSGFVAIPGATTVSFAGVTAPIVAVTPTTIFASVPTRALTGNVTVTTPLGVSNGVTFTIPNSSTVQITTFAPNPTSVGSTLTLGGSGFVSPAGNNTVTFTCTGPAYGYSCTGGKVNGNVVSGGPQSLGVTVPLNAVSGPVQVVNSFGSSSNVYLSVSLTGTPYITDTFPTEGVDNQDMYLEGLLFGRTQGTVVFKDSTGNSYAATIRQWRDNQVRVTVPWQIAAGAVTVTITNSSNLSESYPWTVLHGNVNVGSFSSFATLPQGGEALHLVWSGHQIYFVGGGGSNNIAELTVNSQGGPVALTNTVGNLPFGTSSPDIHSNTNTWQGDRYWIFDNNTSSNKAYLQFDQSGNLIGNNIIGPAFTVLNGTPFYQQDTAIAGGPKGIYMAGADTSATAVYNNLVYELFDPSVDNIGPWQSIGLDGGGNDHEDEYAIVLQNNLWFFGYDSTETSSGYGQRVTALNALGAPTGVNLATDSVTPDSGYEGPAGPQHADYIDAIGNFLYQFGTWPDSTTVWQTPLESGSYPENDISTWPTYGTSPIALPGGAEGVVVGGYVYMAGGGNANTNVILYAPIS